MLRTIKKTERYDLVNTPVTLNGQPAQVAGVKLDFPSVRITATGEAYQWSWQSVADIVACGGDFVS